MTSGNQIFHAARNILLTTICAVLLLSQASLVLWSTAKKLSYHWFQHGSTHTYADTIFVPAKDINTILWTETDEIRYGNRMFDIKKHIQSGDDMLLIGHYDSWENKLYDFLFRILKNEDDCSSDSRLSGFMLWAYDAILVNPPILRLHIIPCIKKTYHLLVEPNFTSISKDTDIQPPEE